MVRIGTGDFTREHIQYVLRINSVLRQIRISRPGVFIFQSLENSPMQVWIKPLDYSILSPRQRRRRPLAFAAVPAEENAEDAGITREDFMLQRTTARGVNVDVYYDGTNFIEGTLTSRHEVLLHELCHAYAYMNGQAFLSYDRQGHLRSAPMSGGFENINELFAILVTNVHSCELNLSPRGTHERGNFWTFPRHRYHVLEERPYITFLNEFWLRYPVLCQTLSQISEAEAWFNPFRDFRP